MTVAGPHACQ